MQFMVTPRKKLPPIPQARFFFVIFDIQRDFKRSFFFHFLDLQEYFLRSDTDKLKKVFLEHRCSKKNYLIWCEQAFKKNCHFDPNLDFKR